MTEKDLQAVVMKAAGLLGFRTYHTFDSRRSQPGFPDLVLVHPGQRRILYRELKTDVGRPTSAQRGWLKALSDAGADAGIWRVRDWQNGRIERELKGVKEGGVDTARNLCDTAKDVGGAGARAPVRDPPPARRLRGWGGERG